MQFNALDIISFSNLSIGVVGVVSTILIIAMLCFVWGN